MINVVLVASSPRFVKTDLANAYYSEIVEFLEALGTDVKIHQPIAGSMGPLPIGDLYITHGKLVERLELRPTECSDAPAIALGYPGGVIHAVDLAWQEAGGQGIPPNEHYVFTADQKLAIQSVVEQLDVPQPDVGVTPLPRQSASRRPGVR